MAIKLKAIIKHPGQVIGGTGLAITKENGVYTYDLDFSELSTADTIADDTATYFPIFTPGASDDDPDVYEMVSVETFLSETAAVNQSRQVISGAGLTGGGDLSADRTLVVGAGTGITVNADDVALDTASSRNVDHTAVSVIAGAGLTGGGTIAADRTLTVGAGTGITVNADDVALATQPAYTVMVNSTAGAAAPSGVKISALTDRAGFGPGDKVMIEESTGEMRKVDYSDLPGAGSIGGSTGATDNSALRADGTGGATIQSSALIIADTTGALSRSGNGGIPVQGTNTNDSASAGDKGEYISSDVPSGSFALLTTGVAANVTSISLTAGDWDVTFVANYQPAPGTTISATQTSISLTSATSDATLGRTTTIPYFGAAVATYASFFTNVVPARRISLNSTTTVYGVALAVFAVSNLGVYGNLSARRVR